MYDPCNGHWQLYKCLIGSFRTKKISSSLKGEIEVEKVLWEMVEKKYDG